MNNKEFNKYYFTCCLGFILFCIFIYIQFIRNRLPREIPFILNDWRLYLLLFIIFIFIIYTNILINL